MKTVCISTTKDPNISNKGFVFQRLVITCADAQLVRRVLVETLAQR